MSARENESTNCVYAPAWTFVTPAVNVGAKPFTHPESIVNDPPDGDAVAPFQPVICDVAEYVPQAVGEAMTARAPPKKSSLKSVNGNCGSLSNVVVTWPVVGLRSIRPGSFSRTPSAWATT